MMDRERILGIVDDYDLKKAKIGMVASHSALDVCDGAVEEGFQDGRHMPGRQGQDLLQVLPVPAGRLTARSLRGVVDECWTLKKFKEMMDPKFQERLRKENILFVPNRSFTSYVDLKEIENDFAVPLVGSRALLRSEERGEEKDYYWLLEKAGLPFPKKYRAPGGHRPAGHRQAAPQGQEARAGVLHGRVVQGVPGEVPGR